MDGENNNSDGKKFDLSEYGINQAGNVEIQDALSLHVKKAFNDAVLHKRSIGIEAQLLRNLRANKCQYQPDEIALLGPYNDVYLGIAALKARAAESWLIDIILNNIDKPWTLDPTKEPDIPPEQREWAISQLIVELPGIASEPALKERVRQLKAASNEIAYKEAEFATKRMETKIEDQLSEGGWTSEFAKLVAEITVYPSVFMRGPVVVAKKTGVWKDNKYVPTVESLPTVRCIPAFDAFPSPDSTTTQDGQYFCERTRFSSGALYNLIKVPGFNAGNIRQVIEDHPNGYRSEMFGDAERQRLEDKTADSALETVDDAGGMYETIIYNGVVKGEMLAEHGVIVRDPQDSYECEVWSIDGTIVKAVLNPNPTGARPIYGTSYRKVVGTIWGQSVIDLVYDVQRMCNAAARNIVRNMGYSAGPIGEVVGERVADTQDPTDISPYTLKIVGPDLTGTGAKAYNFHNIKSVAPDLMNVFNQYLKYADDLSGVPAYVLGNPQVAGAGRTLGGLSMLMGNAAKGIKNVQLNMDRDVIAGVVEGFFNYNMLTSDDDSIKCDAKVVARGATGLLQRELAQTRTIELLQLLAPYIENWENLPDGIKIMLREVLKSTGLPVDDIIPDPNIGDVQRNLVGLVGGRNMVPQVNPGGQATALNRGTSTPVPLPPQSQPQVSPPLGSGPINMPQGA